MSEARPSASTVTPLETPDSAPAASREYVSSMVFSSGVRPPQSVLLTPTALASTPR